MSTTHHTTLRRILAGFAYFRTHPGGLLPTGLWTEPHWTEEEFRAWFLSCVLRKCQREERRTGGRKYGLEYEQYLRDLALDRATVRDYQENRLRHSGCMNILRTEFYRLRYPHINTQPREE